MPKFLLPLFFFLSVTTVTAVSDNPPVYICTGGSSVCYHKTSDCRGLSRCSREIIPVSLEDAQKDGRRPCKICYGNNN